LTDDTTLLPALHVTMSAATLGLRAFCWEQSLPNVTRALEENVSFRNYGAVGALCLTSLVGLVSSATAQSAGIQLPATLKGFDPQPDPPGKSRLSDIAFPAGNGGLSVGRRQVQWGDQNRLALDASDAQAAGGGSCLFDVTYHVSNLTQVPTAAFADALVAYHLDGNLWSPAGPVEQPGIKLSAAQTLGVGARITLRPGTSLIRVLGDIGHAVTELDENNNQGVVYVSLTGDCGVPSMSNAQGESASRVSAASSPGVPAVPQVPGDQKAIVRFLPPGTINTADQTDERPAPNIAGYGVPDTKAARGSAQMGDGSVRPADGSIIINDLRRSLTTQLGAAASQIVVRIEGGDVSLIGKVPSADARIQAERIAKSVPGVTSVRNQLLVQGGQ
jgi:hyperosmotically inducible protein